MPIIKKLAAAFVGLACLLLTPAPGRPAPQADRSTTEGVGPWNVDFNATKGWMYLLDLKILNNRSPGTESRRGTNWRLQCIGVSDADSCSGTPVPGVFFNGISVDDQVTIAVSAIEESVRCGVYVELNATWNLAFERREGDRVVEAMYREQTRRFRKAQEELREKYDLPVLRCAE